MKFLQRRYALAGSRDYSDLPREFQSLKVATRSPSNEWQLAARPEIGSLAETRKHVAFYNLYHYSIISHNGTLYIMVVSLEGYYWIH